MHELSIAHNIVNIASTAAAEAGAEEISVVHLRIGALAGVVADALRFSFAIAAEGTPLANAELIIEEVPVTVFCPTCNTEVTLPNPRLFRCPQCGQPSGQIVHGRELELVALETP
ncbi:hydrogenase nickel incorporation protein HypA [Chloroflexus islandicus]|uniref:Hydrogenase maturation factor HypA n=1 Tax=Chloroflexus islandicus TaxID=1707952 RepID=A0A178MK03_9CHLR|nr:hydrogenase maturation nickel metallochaperone HypA [Chloroflexus islandicus]OAN48375.1 hydrogenase nickel incorporation protein HypA [Chloroflexus islandicus]